MTTLITPYGTTAFQQGSHRGVNRANWVEITHPNGEKERVEYSEELNLPWSEPLGIVPKGVPVRNYVLWARNTCHWDRKAYAEGYAKLDYTKARIYHWLHGQDYATASGILESYKNPLEHRVWFNYDGQVNATFVGTSDQPTKIARTLEDGTTQLHQFEYNSLSKPTKAIDPLGRTFSFIYGTNEVDLVEVRQTRAGQNELLISATYNAQHQPLTITDAAGQTTAFGYNTRGQILAMTNALSHATTYSYDSNGYLLAVDGPLPGTNDMRRYTHDGVGRLRTASDVDGYLLTFDYDNLDRLTRITYPDGTYESATYNRLDIEVLRDRAGRETRLTHDSLQQLIAVEDPLGRVTRYDWCGCGALDAIIDALGRATHWIRDVQGRVKAEMRADGSLIRYDYDIATGWLKSIRDEQNQITRFDYNLDGSVRQKRYLNALVPTPAVKFTYDPNYRRLLSMEDGTGVTSFSYHPISGSPSPGAGEMASIDGPLPNDTITLGYDELGRQAVRGINGVAVRRSWDEAGRLTQMTNALGIFTYSWEGASRRLSAVDMPGGQRTTFGYLPNLKDQLPQHITHLKADGGLLSRFSYDYNVVPRIVRWTQERSGASPVEWVFEYDAADQLTNAVATQNGASVESYAYSYDAGENRIAEATSTGTQQFFHNALNELTSVSGTVSVPVNFEWDAEYRLVAITEGNKRSEFSYDGLDRRVRIVEKTNGMVVSDKRFVWCGTTLSEERDGSGSQIVKRFFARGVQAASDVDVPAGNYLFTRDHLGSLREMTDMTGTVRARHSYDPFGRRSRVDGNVDADFGFTGHYVHSPSSLHLALYRAYRAGIARWLSRDPLGEEEGSNLYAYASNDPLNRIDELGLADLVLDKPGTDLTQFSKQHKSPDGEFVAIIHGNPKGPMMWNKASKKYEAVTAKDLARKIRETRGFKEGMKVRLVSCRTGSGNFPQELADFLQSTVEAPTVRVSIDNLGNVDFKKGEKNPGWKPFTPGARPSSAKQTVEIRLPPD
jgi:RHS repeat-associated protein